jgi:hypothetical protein
VLLAGLSASMSIPWCDSRSERLFDVTESVLGIGISGESPPNRTFHPWRSKCPYRRLTRTWLTKPCSGWPTISYSFESFCGIAITTFPRACPSSRYRIA